MHVMRRLKSIASGRSSVSDPGGDLATKRVKVDQVEEQNVNGEALHLEKATKDADPNLTSASVEFDASTSTVSSTSKPEKPDSNKTGKTDYDQLPKEMLEMKIKEDKSDRHDEKDVDATVVKGNGTETGQIITTTVGGRNGEPKQKISYMAERVVGTGSFGVVFQANCLETGEAVAIKKVLQDKRYKNRELQMMKLLDHPNIVKLKHYFFSTTDKDELYLNLVLEYVSETVYRVEKHYSRMNQYMPILYVQLYTYQICRALAYVHKVVGVCHRDIKPQNLLVTWVEHAEYDASTIHHLYRPLISAGMGFGAQRWVAALERQCEYLAILMSSIPTNDHSAITLAGRRSMLKLAQRMTNNFCAGVCASTIHNWNKLNTGNFDEDVRVMTRKSIDDPGEPPGVVLSAAMSVWLPVSPKKLFDFLRDESLRSEWDILSNGGPMQEMTHIAKGRDQGNCVSLLRASTMNTSQSSMLILQETCIDASGALVVYAPVDIPAMHVVMSGGDSAYVALLRSGFAILPDGSGSGGGSNQQTDTGGGGRGGGSLLTVAFQILVNSLPTAKLTVESVETVNNLISCTVQKIKAAVHC